MIRDNSGLLGFIAIKHFRMECRSALNPSASIRRILIVCAPHNLEPEKIPPSLSTAVYSSPFSFLERS